MSFFRDCWESVRGIFRDCMTTPLSRKKLLIFGGVFLALVLLVVVLSVSLGRSSGSGSSKGSDVFNDGPLTSGGVDSKWLKSMYMNQISENTTKIYEQLKSRGIVKTKLGAIIWSVGASDCNAASQKDAVSQTLEAIDAATRMASEIDDLTKAISKDDLLKAKSNSEVGVMIALDGGYTIDSRPAVLRAYYTLGARILTLTGNCSTPWAAKSGDNGLTVFGEGIVDEANRLGIVVDLAGSSDAVIRTVVDKANKSAPILFNGIGAKNLTDNPTNINDDTIRRLTGNTQNLVMVSFKCDHIRNDTSKSCTAAEAINHINKFAALTSKSQVGIAADFGDAAEYPSDLSNMTGLGKLFDDLKENHGWDLNDLRGLAYNNFFNLISNAVGGDLAKKPFDSLEERDEFTNKNATTACYSDLDIRYPNTPRPDPPTTQSPPITAPPTTAPPTTATPITTSTPKPTPQSSKQGNYS